MTNRCHHIIKTKSSLPDVLLCENCRTTWYISECAKLSRKEFLLLPLDVRRIILNKQAEKFTAENPDYYKGVE
ncbi:MAG: hypothetical protein WC389_18795 [Lutibacter sp.]|jgi:hypothetical protein